MSEKKKPEPKKGADAVEGDREHRRYERLRLDTRVKYKVIKKPGAHAKGLAADFQPDGRSINISLCGLAIATDAAVQKGDYLKVELSLPGKPQIIRALTEVVWTSMDGGRNLSGIRFLILLNQADDASIRRFIEEHPDRAPL
jgi:hypothetical protein